jgi:hypothetical protein
VDTDIRHTAALTDHFVERSRGIGSLCIRQWKLFDDRFGKARRLSAMMDDRLRISHSTMRHHFFNVLHQTIALLLQTATGWFHCACLAPIWRNGKPQGEKAHQYDDNQQTSALQHLKKVHHSSLTHMVHKDFIAKKLTENQPHAELTPLIVGGLHELLRGELAALIGMHHLRFAMMSDHLL